MSELKVIDPLKQRDELAASTTLGRPVDHWSLRVYGDPIKDDFRVFMTLMWRHLGLPDPTPLQLSIAYYLQHHGWNGEIDTLIVMAFRGAAKSWITAAYVLWQVLRDPQLKIGVFSGSARRAVNFVNFCMALIHEMPILKHLQPRPDQRQSSTAFDVSPARPDQTPSVFALGITAAVVGYRADIIVGDDVETNKNSMTPEMREKVEAGCKEFSAIIKPYGQIILLGTPQSESSVYNKLASGGYAVQIWPARFPNGKQRRIYGSRLAAYITYTLDRNPSLVGTSTEPKRFSEEDLAKREIAWGRAGFALQYMLDTSLSDVDKFPLRLGDIIVMSLDRRMGPDAVSWGSGEHLRLRDVQPISLDGDALYAPSSVSQGFSRWQAVRASIDTSGKGADETVLTIGAVIHATPFVLKQVGWQDGFSPKTLEEIAQHLVDYHVQQVIIEEDFGGGMFAALLRPVLKKAWEKANAKRPAADHGATEIVEQLAKRVQKELRILEILEPVFQAHRLVVAKEVLEEDMGQVSRRDGTDLRDRYSLMYQITRLTREKDCLTHDDRVDSLAILVLAFKEYLGLHAGEEFEAKRERDLEDELHKFDETFSDIQGRSGHARRALRGNLRQGGRRPL